MGCDLNTSVCVPAAHTALTGIATTEGRKNGDRAPGDFSFDPLNLGKNPATYKKLQLSEVKNGRCVLSRVPAAVCGCAIHVSSSGVHLTFTTHAMALRPRSGFTRNARREELRAALTLAASGVMCNTAGWP